MLRTIIRKKDIPHSPGCYLMKDASDAVIYVGKAKDLKKRLFSYLHARDEKTTELVAHIADVDYMATDTETESLLLEAQLIQKYHPRYNIDLQSGGTRYAYIKETTEAYPRFVIARKRDAKGKFFGPFVSSTARNETLREAQDIFRLCKKPGKGKACFRHHLGRCSGACIKAVSSEEYAVSVRSAEQFLRGDFKHVSARIEQQMKKAAQNQLFEKAKLYRDQFLALKKIESQKVSRVARVDQDVCNYIISGDTLLLQIFHFNRGVISGKKEFRFSLADRIGIESELVESFLVQYYLTNTAPHEVIIPHTLPSQSALEPCISAKSGRHTVFTVPQRGVKKKLLEMVKKNLALKLASSGDQLVELQKILRLDRLPMIIDCVDISTLSGVESVGSLVHFVNGNPVKAGYRKFKIKKVEGMNDFAMIREVVGRFARRVNDGAEQRPDLLVIDGGRGQLNSAMKALREEGLAVPAIGLAKKLEEIYVSWADKSLRVSRRSAALQLLQRLRDEAHRFAITFNRKRRSIKKQP